MISRHDPLGPDRPGPDRSRTPSVSEPGRGSLALTLQEAFTVGVRLRTNRQVATDAGVFRAHVKQVLLAADRDAQALGYGGEAVRLAIYAYVAFLDESVLTSSQPMFSAWSQQSLQEEIFGDHVAGENFYRNLAELLGRQDSEELADLLEVYQLCLLLGFHGKYAANPAGLQSTVAMVQDKILRIRGGVPPLAPEWGLPVEERVPTASDPWLRRLGIAAAVALLLAATVYVVFGLSLSSSLDELRGLSASLVG